VLVATPGLPNTGLPPQENTIPWSSIVLIGAFALISISTVMVLKKTKI
jgi:hypothetical protein